MTAKPLEPAPKPPKWTTAVLVCKECTKRTTSDNAPKKLTKMLRKRLKADRRRDVRVLRTGCMGVCPKRGVTVSIPGTETWVVESTGQWESLVEQIPTRR